MDCEAIREALLGPTGKWTILGQSYGGFCATTYLSYYPCGLQAVLMTGGLPPFAARPVRFPHAPVRSPYHSSAIIVRCPVRFPHAPVRPTVR